MSFLDHIARCNTFDLADFSPWYIGASQAGWVHREFASQLAKRGDLFTRDDAGWHLSDALRTGAERSAAIEAFLLELRAQGLVRGWRDERYPVTPRLDVTPLMGIERAAAPLFGIREFGVHMTGYVRRTDGLHIWVPRRAATKATWPGMLDNTVAGGQPVGMSLRANMIKECAEEAGIPESIAREVRAVGFVSYVYQSGMELKPDIQHCFELELPADFVPRAVDGEVESFALWPLQRVFETVRDTFDFKYNCNLVLIDFFLRHGLIDPDDADWFKIANGLRNYPDGLSLPPKGEVPAA